MTNELTLELPHPVLGPGQSIAEKALRVPSQMVLQVASGLDDPAEIAKRYGFSDDEWAALQNWQPFQQEVSRTRAELEKSGFDFVLDSRLKAKELSNVLFLRAMATDTTFSQVHDAMRTYAELGDLKPKNTENGKFNPQTAPGFSISIVFKGEKPDTSPSPSPKNVTIDVEPIEEPPREVMGTRNPFSVETA
jgi:hypothetical protein